MVPTRLHFSSTLLPLCFFFLPPPPASQQAGRWSRLSEVRGQASCQSGRCSWCLDVCYYVASDLCLASRVGVRSGAVVQCPRFDTVRFRVRTRVKEKLEGKCCFTFLRKLVVCTVGDGTYVALYDVSFLLDHVSHSDDTLLSHTHCHVTHSPAVILLTYWQLSHTPALSLSFSLFLSWWHHYHSLSQTN